MVKALCIISRCAVVMTIVGILFLFIALKTNDKRVEAYLEQIANHQLTASDQANAGELPLVATTAEFANRINPPIKVEEIDILMPPREPIPTDDSKAEDNSGVKLPPVFVPKYELVGIVIYERYPEKSLALLKTKANKYEWFARGQKIGHHQIAEITENGMVIINGGKRQTLMLPPKQKLALLREV